MVITTGITTISESLSTQTYPFDGGASPQTITETLTIPATAESTVYDLITYSVVSFDRDDSSTTYLSTGERSNGAFYDTEYTLTVDCTSQLGAIGMGTSETTAYPCMTLSRYEGEGRRGLSWQAMAGVVVGAVVSLLVMAGLAGFFIKKHRRRRLCEGRKSSIAPDSHDGQSEDSQPRKYSMTTTPIKIHVPKRTASRDVLEKSARYGTRGVELQASPSWPLSVEKAVNHELDRRGTGYEEPHPGNPVHTGTPTDDGGKLNLEIDEGDERSDETIGSMSTRMLRVPAW